MTRPTRTVPRNRAPELPGIKVADWRGQASCAGDEPAKWDFDQPDRWREGVAICGSCPVKAECLADTLKQEAKWVKRAGKHGRAMIYAGLTPVQRSRIAAGKDPGPAYAKAQPREQAPPWATGAPCVSCGTPCASDRVRRRDTDVRDRYLRHVGDGLCLNCWRKVHGRGDRKRKRRQAAPRPRDDQGRYVVAS